MRLSLSFRGYLESRILAQRDTKKAVRPKKNGKPSNQGKPLETPPPINPLPTSPKSLRTAQDVMMKGDLVGGLWVCKAIFACGNETPSGSHVASTNGISGVIGDS
ncbi:hypothetical protein Leryth_005425 [Lithospermum erythrorhizon]|nr:hypothetical protein Leryth_005425 [Lithospermum erythrorhizon]